MKLFDPAGQVDLAAFDETLLRQTANLEEVVRAAQRTRSASIESTHFLIALTRIPTGITRELFQQQGIGAAQLEAGLEASVTVAQEPVSLGRLSPELLDESGRRVMAALESYLEAQPGAKIDEMQLLDATLDSLTSTVADALRDISISPRSLITALRADQQRTREYIKPTPFVNGAIQLEAFSQGGQRVIELMRTEAESLGYQQMDTRHLLLGLLDYSSGATQMILYQQDIQPRKIQERLMFSLRARTQKSRSRLELAQDHMHPSVVRIIDQAAEATRADRAAQIAEVHLLRAFLGSETIALRQLFDAGVNLVTAMESARRFKPGDVPEQPKGVGLKPWQAVLADLEGALVGQADAVRMCLPFIRRMHFGFRRPGKPAGVFLFCGPSGSGKTEMAKAITRAVFGSEEHLIMLEMGQFQTKESMNIFIGAPPGYIGYGEGKLTNGLRDKRRAVVLFDEIEKAHPEVFDALLRFIDEGQIDDPAGPVRDGSECIIIMTSNVRTEGLESLLDDGGYQKNKWGIRRELKKALLNRSVETRIIGADRQAFRFRPEFLNRIDEIILFRSLDENDLTEIARRLLTEYARRLHEEKQISITFVPMLEAAAKRIGYFCTSVDEGARATLRITQSAVVDPVIDFLYDQDRVPPVALEVHFPHSDPAYEPQGVIQFPEE